MEGREGGRKGGKKEEREGGKNERVSRETTWVGASEVGQEGEREGFILDAMERWKRAYN